MTSLLLALLLAPQPAEALPLYAQRSGRTCGNCHISPTWEDEKGWDNPALAWRKCTMSCLACHVDPAGGGLRNVSGRYYGQSTLAIVHTQERSYSDLNRELIGQTALYRLQRLVNKGPTTDDDGRFVPSDWSEVQEGVGRGQTGAWQSGGSLSAHRMAWWDGRYGNLTADPVLQVGGDLRGAYWSGSGTSFPMQAEISAAFHPTHHVTALVSGAARGQTTGAYATEPDLPIYPRRALLMTHEWPMMAWAKAGIFQPSFGTYIDDHTSPVRSLFELSTSTSEDTVAGVEVGMAPNYPFVAASVFANDTSAVAGGDRDQGWGAALHGGWRDLGWSLTGHGQVRQRGGEGRGDLLAGGVGVGFNPMYYVPQLPLTWLGELTVGQRVRHDERTGLGAAQSDLALLLCNGVQLQMHHDLVVAELGSPVQIRHQVGGEVSPVPGLTFEAAVRALQSPGAETGVDVFLTNHLWF